MIRIPGIIPINIYPIFWVLSIAIAVLNSSNIQEILIWIGIVFVSVLIHEFGHAITALSFGQKAHIDLLGFGGLTHRHGKKLSKWQDFLVTLNGPLAGFLFYLTCMGLYTYLQPPKNGLLSYTLFYTATINLFWTVLNLLPIQPLDGGHLLRITLEGLFGLKGIKVALFISIALAGLMTVLGFVSHQLLIGIVFFMFTFENYRLFKDSLSMTDFDQDSVLQNMLKSAKKDLSVGNFEGALNQFQQIRDVSKKGIIYNQATESMAEILDQLGKYEDGFNILEPVSKSLSPESLLLYHKLAFQSNHFDVAAKVGDKAYQLHPGYEVALINSLSHSIIDQTAPAIGWLKCAIRDGLPNIYAITTKSEYDNIRQLEAFQEIQSKYR